MQSISWCDHPQPPGVPQRDARRVRCPVPATRARKVQLLHRSWSGSLHAAAGLQPEDGSTVDDSSEWLLLRPSPSPSPAPASQPHRPESAAGSQGLFRFWHDEKRFKGTGDTSLAQQTLLALRGVRTGGHVKAAPTTGPLGWQVLDQWDLLWSPSSTASKAAEVGLHMGQLTSAVPGSRCLTRKKSLVGTLRQAYGADMLGLGLTPLTFELPTQLQEMLEHVTREQQRLKAELAAARAEQQQRQHRQQSAHKGDAQEDLQGQGGTGPGQGPAAAGDQVLQQPMWILKTSQHLGQGVVICPQREVIKQVLMRQQAVLEAPLAQHKQLRPFVVVQQYVHDPFLIHGRKFGIRLWALVTSAKPLRVWLHCNGLVLFSNQEYQAADVTDMQRHLTNYAQNMDGDVWSLDQLRQHLGQASFFRMLRQVIRTTSMTFAAAAPHMADEWQRCSVPNNSAFELFGLDFVLDYALHPWLLEVNATPSLAVEHAKPAMAALIHEQKQGMLDDMFELLGVPQRFTATGRIGTLEEQELAKSIMRQAKGARQDLLVLCALIDTEMELTHRCGWLPLMHMLPKAEEARAKGWKLGLTAMDDAVRSWCSDRLQARAGPL